MADQEKTVRVLVVSRDEAVLEDARFGFPSNAVVETARDATEAETMMKDLTPSVVVVDLMTGNAGGYALASSMGFIRALKDVPILFLLDREQDAWLAHQAGAAMHRVKPISGEALAADALSLAS